MKTSILRTLCALCSLGLTVATATASVLHGPVVNPSNGHRYYLLTSAAWTASEAQAVALGGHLVTINDAAEQQWVYSTFIPYALATGQRRPALWMGLNDAAVEGTFAWASGEPVTFSNWYPGEPNNMNGAEDYVCMNDPSAGPVIAGTWVDLPDNAYAPSSPIILFGIVEVPPADLSATGLTLDTAQSSVSFSYVVANANLAMDTTAALYWASEPNYLGIIGGPAYETTISRAVGNYGPIPVAFSTLTLRPPDAKYLLLVVDPPSLLTPHGLVEESDEANNLFPLELVGCPDSPVASQQMLDYLRKWAGRAEDFQDEANLRTLIQKSIAAGFDPRFILGIAGADTTFGRDLPGDFGTHNYWNVKYHDGTHTGRFQNYKDFSEAVADVLSRLSRHDLYGDAHTIQEFVEHYIGDADNTIISNKKDPCNTLRQRECWKKNVSNIMTGLGYPGDDKDVTCTAAANYPIRRNSAAALIGCPAVIRLLDPLGRKSGAGCGSPASENEIPGAVFTTINGETKGVWIPDTIDGVYMIFICGTADGAYSLDLTFVDAQGKVSGPLVTGNITAGEVIVFLAAISNTDSSQTTVTQLLLPTCSPGGPYTAECNGTSTSVRLDGSVSTDPNGSQLTFLWTTGCPGATFDDPTSPTPMLVLNSASVPETCHVTLTVRNACGLQSSCSTTVSVRDTTPPAIGTVTATPSLLWPANHKMIDVAVNYTVADRCAPVAKITSTIDVTSNEPVNVLGDGNQSPDWEIVDAHHVRLRAERSGRGNGRVYTITVTSTDTFGNAATASTRVFVPHSQGR